jgi:hypothetical protein
MAVHSYGIDEHANDNCLSLSGFVRWSIPVSSSSAFGDKAHVVARASWSAVLVAYLGVLGYVWFDALSNGEGWGWAVVGTLNVTFAALLLIATAWLVARVVKRTRRKPTKQL